MAMPQFIRTTSGEYVVPTHFALFTTSFSRKGDAWYETVEAVNPMGHATLLCEIETSLSLRVADAPAAKAQRVLDALIVYLTKKGTYPADSLDMNDFATGVLGNSKEETS